VHGLRGCKGGDQKARAAYLAGGIDDLGRIFLILIADDLAERVLDGGVVALYKVTVDELHRQARFAWAVRSMQRIQGQENLPTALLPTMAILRCLGPAMVVLAACEVYECC